MLFFSKRTNVPQRSSNVEACVSILGLILVIGLLGGLAGLIYGLVKQILLSTIVGAVVLGVSAFFSIILALVFACCLKNNDVNSNTNEHHPSRNRHQHAQQRRRQRPSRSINHTKVPSHEISVVSGTHRMDQHQQRQSTVHNVSMASAPTYNGLGDSTNYGYGKQMSQSPSKTSPFASSNQPNGSVSNNNHNSYVKPNDYNRH